MGTARDTLLRGPRRKEGGRRGSIFRTVTSVAACGTNWMGKAGGRGAPVVGTLAQWSNGLGRAGQQPHVERRWEELTESCPQSLLLRRRARSLLGLGPETGREVGGWWRGEWEPEQGGDNS